MSRLIRDWLKGMVKRFLTQFSPRTPTPQWKRTLVRAVSFPLRFFFARDQGQSSFHQHLFQQGYPISHAQKQPFQLTWLFTFPWKSMALKKKKQTTPQLFVQYKKKIYVQDLTGNAFPDDRFQEDWGISEGCLFGGEGWGKGRKLLPHTCLVSAALQPQARLSTTIASGEKTSMSTERGQSTQPSLKDLDLISWSVTALTGEEIH